MIEKKKSKYRKQTKKEQHKMGRECFEIRLFKTTEQVLYSLVLVVWIAAAGVFVCIVDGVVFGTRGCEAPALIARTFAKGAPYRVTKRS